MFQDDEVTAFQKISEYREKHVTAAEFTTFVRQLRVTCAGELSEDTRKYDRFVDI